MTVSRKDKREWWNELLQDRPKKSQWRLIRIDHRDLWVRACDMVSSLRLRMGKLVSNIRVKDNPKYREKWPLDGK